MTHSHAAPLVSAIIPVGARQSPLADIHARYKSGLEMLDSPYEMIFVLDGPQPARPRQDYHCAAYTKSAAGRRSA